MKQKINVWEGVYNCWEEAPGGDDVCDGRIWIDKVTVRAQKALAAYRASETVSLVVLTYCPWQGGCFSLSSKAIYVF